MRSLQLLVLALLATVAWADSVTYTTSGMIYDDGDVPEGPPAPYVLLPGFHSSLGKLTDVNVTSSFSMGLTTEFTLLLGSWQQNEMFSFNYSPSIEVSVCGAQSAAAADVGSIDCFTDFSLGSTVSVTGIANEPGPRCCELPLAPWEAFIGVTTAATTSFDISDLKAFTSSPDIAFENFWRSFNDFPGDPHYWAGDFELDATVTYSYTPTPEPATVLMLGAAMIALGRGIRHFRRG